MRVVALISLLAACLLAAASAIGVDSSSSAELLEATSTRGERLMTGSLAGTTTTTLSSAALSHAKTDASSIFFTCKDAQGKMPMDCASCTAVVHKGLLGTNNCIWCVNDVFDFDKGGECVTSKLGCIRESRRYNAANCKYELKVKEEREERERKFDEDLKRQALEMREKEKKEDADEQARKEKAIEEAKQQDIAHQKDWENYINKRRQDVKKQNAQTLIENDTANEKERICGRGCSWGEGCESMCASVTKDRRDFPKSTATVSELRTVCKKACEKVSEFMGPRNKNECDEYCFETYSNMEGIWRSKVLAIYARDRKALADKAKAQRSSSR